MYLMLEHTFILFFSISKGKSLSWFYSFIDPFIDFYQFAFIVMFFVSFILYALRVIDPFPCILLLTN